MGNFWIEQIELEEIANDLADYIMNKAKGKKFPDPQHMLDATVASFYNITPGARKYQHRINVSATVAKAQDGSGYFITNISVVCH